MLAGAYWVFHKINTDPVAKEKFRERVPWVIEKFDEIAGQPAPTAEPAATAAPGGNTPKPTDAAT
jgi:hypothetical protein